MPLNSSNTPTRAYVSSAYTFRIPVRCHHDCARRTFCCTTNSMKKESCANEALSTQTTNKYYNVFVAANVVSVEKCVLFLQRCCVTKWKWTRLSDVRVASLSTAATPFPVATKVISFCLFAIVTPKNVVRSEWVCLACARRLERNWWHSIFLPFSFNWLQRKTSARWLLVSFFFFSFYLHISLVFSCAHIHARVHVGQPMR